MKIPIFTVDAFTSEPFTGNPAAVCLLESDLPEDVMQKIATEMNLSETAFVSKENINDEFASSANFKLRWFTPTHEVNLCGHATLSTAAVIFYTQKNQNRVLSFNTLSGILQAENTEDGIVLNMPLNTPKHIETPSSKLKQLVSLVTEDSGFIEIFHSNDTKKLLIRLPDDFTMEKLCELNIDPKALMATYNEGDVMGVIITMKGSKESVGSNGKRYDFISRYFAPWHGIDEDPVTGSAHTVLAGYWMMKLEKENFFCRQCSKRGGELKLQICNERVKASGKAVIVMEGFLNIPLMS